MKAAARPVLAIVLAVLLGISVRSFLAEQVPVDGVWRTDPPPAQRGVWTPIERSATETQRPEPIVAGRQVVSFDQSKLLADYVKPGDIEVEINDHDVPPFMPVGGEDGAQELRFMTRRAAAVVVARVAAMHSEPNAMQDWLTSTLDLEIETVLKPGTGIASVSAGDRVSFTFSGGDATIAGARVIAKSKYDELPQAGGVYLFFLFVDPVTFVPPDRRLSMPQLRLFPWGQTFEITENTLHRLQSGVDGGLDRGFDAAKAFDIVRSVANLPLEKN